MLSFFTPQGRVFIKSTLLKNRGVQLFLLPKVGFIGVAFFLALSGLVWLAALLWLLAELLVTVWKINQDVAEGFTTVRSRDIAGGRLALSLLWGALTFTVFNWFWLWLAVPLSLVALLLVLGGYITLAVKRIIKDWVGVAPTEHSTLFEKIRQMQDLDAAATQIEALLLTKQNLDAQRDLVYYLGWANTFRGHRLLPSHDYKNALAYYKRALQVDPASMAARVSLAICYLQQNDFELALNQTRQAIAIFNGKQSKPKYDSAHWHWHRNEVSSEYEQSAGLFQLCALGVGKVQISAESGAAKEFLMKEFSNLAVQIPDRSLAELNRLLARRSGMSLSALHLLAAGLFRAPAEPLEMLEQAVTLPLLTVQVVEEAA